MSQQGRTFKNIGSVANLETTDRMEWLANASPQDLVDFTHSGATMTPLRSDYSLNRLLRGSARFDEKPSMPDSVITQTQNSLLAQEAERRKQEELMRLLMLRGR